MISRSIMALLFTFWLSTTKAQQGWWTWVNGSSMANPSGVFGTKGVANPANTPPGLYEASEWTDADGNFWLFGGSTNSTTVYGDLWKYNPSTNEWTWIKGTSLPNDGGDFGTMGVASTTNRPPAVSWGSATWVDSKGDLWLYGGTVIGCGRNTLWKYNIASNMWTWVNGSSLCGTPATYGQKGVPSPLNNPGARNEFSAAWTDDADNLWCFGGGDLNDLWRYSIATNEWTWMAGGSTTGQPNVYGVKGLPAANNTPGSRFAFASWVDKQKKFWLFGGYKITGINYNDMWKYDPATNLWTWMSGTDQPNDSGNYGALCIPDLNNYPAGGYENRARWTDECGNFWLYSGAGSYYNDLWKFNPTTLEWTFVNGQHFMWLVPPDYGTQNVAAPTNQPGTRSGALGWKAKDGALYLFGGIVGGFDRDNDLWKYVPDTFCAGCKLNSLPHVAFAATDSVLCEKNCIDFFDLSTNTPTQWQWTFTGGSPSGSTLQNPTNICFNSYGDYAVSLVATNPAGSDSAAINSFIHVVQNPAQPTITISNDTLYSSAGVTYQWFFNNVLIQGATLPYYVVQSPGNYYVIISDTNGCANNSLQVFVSDIDDILWRDDLVEIFPNPANDELEILIGHKITVGNELNIYNVLGKKVYNTAIHHNGKYKINVAGFESGMYILELRLQSSLIHKEFYVRH